jgi:hypothetical protein
LRLDGDKQAAAWLFRVLADRRFRCGALNG